MAERDAARERESAAVMEVVMGEALAASGQPDEEEQSTASGQSAQRPARSKIPEEVKRAVFRKAEGWCQHMFPKTPQKQRLETVGQTVVGGMGHDMVALVVYVPFI